MHVNRGQHLAHVVIKLAWILNNHKTRPNIIPIVAISQYIALRQPVHPGLIFSSSHTDFACEDCLAVTAERTHFQKSLTLQLNLNDTKLYNFWIRNLEKRWWTNNCGWEENVIFIPATSRVRSLCCVHTPNGIHDLTQATGYHRRPSHLVAEIWCTSKTQFFIE